MTCSYLNSASASKYNISTILIFDTSSSKLSGEDACLQHLSNSFPLSVLFQNHLNPRQESRRPRSYPTSTSPSADYCSGSSAWGVDNNALCNEVYKLNNPNAEVFTIDLEDFSLHCRYVRADLLLISVPCRPWSRAKRRPGKHDVRNKALLFKIAGIIRIVKPRQVVIEQVDGLIVLREHSAAFTKLVSGIFDEGYNLSWLLVNFRPGEALPNLPEPTHGYEASGLAPIASIRDVLSTIPYDASFNESWHVMKRKKKMGPAYSMSEPMKYTITRCGGNKNYHPCGKHDFNVREYATLQGLTVDYNLKGTVNEVIGMTGDSVPALPSKVIYAQVLKTLEDTDSGSDNVSCSPHDYSILPPTTTSKVAARLSSSPVSASARTMFPVNPKSSARSQREPSSRASAALLKVEPTPPKLLTPSSSKWCTPSSSKRSSPSSAPSTPSKRIKQEHAPSTQSTPTKPQKFLGFIKPEPIPAPKPNLEAKALPTKKPVPKCKLMAKPKPMKPLRDAPGSWHNPIEID